MKVNCENCKKQYNTEDGKYEFHESGKCIETKEDIINNKIGALCAIISTTSILIFILVAPLAMSEYGDLGFVLVVGILLAMFALTTLIGIGVISVFKTKPERC